MPISLLPISSKIFEKIVFKHIYNFFISNYLISKKQQAFTKGNSTVKQIIDRIDNILKSFDNCTSLEFHAVFLNFSEMFEKSLT